MDTKSQSTYMMTLARRAVTVLKRHWAAVLVILILSGSEYTAQRLTQFVQKYRLDSHIDGDYATVVVRGMPYGLKIDEVSYIAAGR